MCVHTHIPTHTHPFCSAFSPDSSFFHYLHTNIRFSPLANITYNFVPQHLVSNSILMFRTIKWKCKRKINYLKCLILGEKFRNDSLKKYFSKEDMPVAFITVTWKGQTCCTIYISKQIPFHSCTTAMNSNFMIMWLWTWMSNRTFWMTGTGVRKESLKGIPTVTLIVFTYC